MYILYIICCLNEKYATCKLFINSVMTEINTENYSGSLLQKYKVTINNVAIESRLINSILIITIACLIIEMIVMSVLRWHYDYTTA